MPSSESDTVIIILNSLTAASVTCLGPDKIGSRPTQDWSCEQSVMNRGRVHGVPTPPEELFWLLNSGKEVVIVFRLYPPVNPTKIQFTVPQLVTQMAQ